MTSSSFQFERALRYYHYHLYRCSAGTVAADFSFPHLPTLFICLSLSLILSHILSDLPAVYLQSIDTLTHQHHKQLEPTILGTMDGKPRFEIVEQIGHGSFSNVYKARWINAPLMPSICSPFTSYDDGLLRPINATNLCQPAANQINGGAKTILKSPLEFNDNFSNHRSIELQQQQQQQLLQLQQISGRCNDLQASKRSSLNNDKYVALKRIKFYEIPNSKLRMDCVKEVKLLQQLKHPNIINYNISFIERNELFIVLELADGGDLSKLIRYFQKRKQLLNERTILKYFTQVCLAVKYIHSKRILHRDIKPANIFMTSDGCVKLGDFGLGRFFSQNTRDAHSIVGTFYYMAPERIRECGYGFSSDIWSLGCVLYELITLNSPFSILNYDNSNNKAQCAPNRPLENNNNFRMMKQNGHHHQKPPVVTEAPQQNPFGLQWLIERVVRAEYPSLANYKDISQRLRELTTECLNPDPDSRPNMDYICAVVSEAYQRAPYQMATSSKNRNTASASSKTNPVPCQQ